MSASREITIDELVGRLGLPEGRVRFGVVDLKLHDGVTVLRLTGHGTWMRLQEFTLDGTEDWPERAERV